jgi:RNA polymerase sigma-70 factor, ECF subfamily
VNGNERELRSAATDDLCRPTDDVALALPKTGAISLGASLPRQSQTLSIVPDTEPRYLSDDELMHLFQTGDERAFLELYKRRHAAIFTFCLRMCAGDRELGKDIFQETFIRIHSRAHQYRENFVAWSRSIARRVAIDHLRKRKPGRIEESHYAIPTKDRADLPDFTIEQELLRSHIDGSLAKLPLKIREPFILHEYEGMKIAEIASELQITEDAVRQRVWRARRRLRELLLPDYRP